MTTVTRDQFEFTSNLEVRHEPTGARITTYEYTNPADACSSIVVDFGRAGAQLPNGEEYDRGDIVRVACELLQEHANARHPGP